MTEVSIYNYHNLETGEVFSGTVKDARKVFGVSDGKLRRMLSDGRMCRVFSHKQEVQCSPCLMFYDADDEWVFTGSKKGCAEELGLSYNNFIRLLKSGDFRAEELSSEKIPVVERIERDPAKREFQKKKYLFKSIIISGI